MRRRATWRVKFRLRNRNWGRGLGFTDKGICFPQFPHLAQAKVPDHSFWLPELRFSLLERNRSAVGKDRELARLPTASTTHAGRPGSTPLLNQGDPPC